MYFIAFLWNFQYLDFGTLLLGPSSILLRVECVCCTCMFRKYLEAHALTWVVCIICWSLTPIGTTRFSVGCRTLKHEVQLNTKDRTMSIVYVITFLCISSACFWSVTTSACWGDETETEAENIHVTSTTTNKYTWNERSGRLILQPYLSVNNSTTSHFFPICANRIGGRACCREIDDVLSIHQHTRIIHSLHFWS